MGMFLADKKVAAAWYHNMLSSPAGQNAYGSTESTLVDGSQVSPLVTWDSKITTVISMLGGFYDAVRKGL